MNKLLIVGTVAFDAIETPFGKTDKILGGAGTFIGLSASHFNLQSAIVSVVGDDFPKGVSIASKATVPTIKSLFIKLSLRDSEAISN